MSPYLDCKSTPACSACPSASRVGRSAGLQLEPSFPEGALLPPWPPPCLCSDVTVFMRLTLTPQHSSTSLPCHLLDLLTRPFCALSHLPHSPPPAEGAPRAKGLLHVWSPAQPGTQPGTQEALSAILMLRMKGGMSAAPLEVLLASQKAEGSLGFADTGCQWPC